MTKNVRRAADRHADQSMTVPFGMRQIWQLCIGHRTLNLPTATAPNRRSGATGSTASPGSPLAVGDSHGSGSSWPCADWRSQIWAHSPASATGHGRRPIGIGKGHGRWWPVVNSGQQCWKACWGQPLKSSNLLSSASLTCKNTGDWPLTSRLVVSRWAHLTGSFPRRGACRCRYQPLRLCLVRGIADGGERSGARR